MTELQPTVIAREISTWSATFCHFCSTKPVRAAGPGFFCQPEMTKLYFCNNHFICNFNDLEFCHFVNNSRHRGAQKNIKCPAQTTFTARDIYTAKVAGITTREPAEAILTILAERGEIAAAEPSKPQRRLGRPSSTRWRLPAALPDPPSSEEWLHSFRVGQPTSNNPSP